MRRKVVLGQLLCLMAMSLLLVCVPFMPRVTGLPRERVAEMAIFWIALWLMLQGSWTAVDGAGGTPRRPLNSGQLAAGSGVFVTTLVCTFVLTHLLITSIDGAGIRVPGLPRGRSIPRELGYSLAVPLLLGMALQIPLLRSGGRDSRDFGQGQRPPRRVVRLLLELGIGLLLIAFAGSVAIFLADRWYAVISVVVTWASGLGYLALASEHAIWSRRCSHMG